jgi:hypothetical protein
MEKFCQTGLSQNGFHTQVSQYSRTLVQAAMQSYNECRQLELNGLAVTHRYTPPKFVSIGFHFTNNQTVAKIDGIQLESDKVECSTQSLKKGTKIVLNGDTPQLTVSGKDDVTIQCNRIAAPVGNGTVRYPETSLVLSISNAGRPIMYTVVMPQDDALGPALSSQYQAHLDDLNGQLATALAQRDAYAQKLQNAAVVEVHPFYVGTPALQEMPSIVAKHYDCGTDIYKAAQASCPADTVAKVEGSTNWNGGSCRYNTYIASCLRK